LTGHVVFGHKLTSFRFSQRKVYEERMIEEETARRVEEMVAKRVEEEVEKRKAEIEKEV